MLMLVNDFMKKKINRRRKRMFYLSTIIRKCEFSMFSTLIMLESFQFDRGFWSYERKDYWF